jgi:hypothetical protein
MHVHAAASRPKRQGVMTTKQAAKVQRSRGRGFNTKTTTKAPQNKPQPNDDDNKKNYHEPNSGTQSAWLLSERHWPTK